MMQHGTLFFSSEKKTELKEIEPIADGKWIFAKLWSPNGYSPGGNVST